MNWPWYIGGIGLASVMVFHWLAVNRMMAVSGRFSAIINRLRFGAAAELPAMSEEDLLAAVRAATAAEFGAGAMVEPDAPPAEEDASPARVRQTLPMHLVFFGGLILGGFVSAVLAGRFAVAFALRGEMLAKIAHGSPIRGAAMLLVGGILVGFGTRMAGGCTSGHGLCGVSRFQPGSIVATMGFFGTGVAVSFLLRALA